MPAATVTSIVKLPAGPGVAPKTPWVPGTYAPFTHTLVPDSVTRAVAAEAAPVSGTATVAVLPTGTVTFKKRRGPAEHPVITIPS